MTNKPPIDESNVRNPAQSLGKSSSQTFTRSPSYRDVLTYSHVLRARWQWLIHQAKHGRAKLPASWSEPNAGLYKFTRDILATIGPMPAPDSALTRKDRTKPYAIGNLEWVPANEPGNRARRKLTDAQVAEIRQRRANGESPKDLARRYGVSPSHVVNVCSGRERNS